MMLRRKLYHMCFNNGFIIFRVNYSTFSQARCAEIDRIRNIGISAHIDAGKTTTTERMLYYAGLIQHMGEVHHGNTVTDYMDQERERGITITSAAVTFNWKNNQFNLIDTPGHIDFTMEVEQTLNVLDGAIVILDGSAGVEAQTITVWRQAERYDIPKIVYVNKMDRSDSNINMCCDSIEKKLEVPHILLQLPVKEKGKFVGIIDVLSLEFLSFGTRNGKGVKRVLLTESEFPNYWDIAQEYRLKVIEKLTDYNEELANKVISVGSFDTIGSTEIVKALRTVTLSKQAVPVLLGSSYKNIGVQSLMDAVILYLPSPVETNQRFTCFEQNLCARAFKVKHDKQRGPLVFLRLYNGSLKKSQKIYSIQMDISEQIGKLYVAYADEFKEVESVENGNIAVVSGLKKIRSGDLITVSNSASQKAKKNLLKRLNKNDCDVDSGDVDTLFGIGAKIPEPVFFCSIEPPSLASQVVLEQALNELQREDPSLRVNYNADTGQTVLAGMGELHLEIIRDRILKEYKVDAELGPLQIAYREAPISKMTDSLKLETKIGSGNQMVNVKLSLLPVNEQNLKDVMKLDKSPEHASDIAGIFPKYLNAVRRGILVGLGNGPKICSQVINCQVMLHSLEVGKGTAETVIAATVTQLVQKLLKEVGTDILEPIMQLEVVCPDEHLSCILADLSRRRAIVNNISMRGKSKIALIETPLSELKGYSTILRTISSGTATFTMEFSHYQKMSAQEELNAIKDIRGF